MMTLVIGGSGSGKSAYAEDLLLARAGNRKIYYIATMQVKDAESAARIQRHQRQREGKGFVTLEQPTGIEQAAERAGACRETAAALLECLSNLTANEMFAEETVADEKAVEEKIVSGIAALKEAFAHTVIVGNNVFEDGITYDEQTMAYVRALGRIQQRLARLADEVIEVAAGIPITWKAPPCSQEECSCS